MGSAIGAGIGLIGQEILGDDPQRAPRPPQRTVTEVEPGVKMVTERDGGTVRKRRVLSDEKKQRKQERESMINDLWGSIGVNDDERAQRFEDAKSTFMEEFKSTAEPQFEEQRERQQAEQAATGRQLSSVGREARTDLEEQQAQEISSASRQAELMAQDMAAKERNQKLQTISQLQSGLRADRAQALQEGRSGDQAASSMYSQNLAAAQTNNAITRSQNQSMYNAAATGAALGGYGDEQVGGLWDAQSDSMFSNLPGGVQQTLGVGEAGALQEEGFTEAQIDNFQQTGSTY